VKVDFWNLESKNTFLGCGDWRDEAILNIIINWLVLEDPSHCEASDGKDNLKFELQPMLWTLSP
jgi:hypothetical protein